MIDPRFLSVDVQVVIDGIGHDFSHRDDVVPALTRVDVLLLDYFMVGGSSSLAMAERMWV